MGIFGVLKNAIWKVRIRHIFVFIVIGLMVFLSAPFIPTGIDWSSHLRPSSLAFLRLQNPYNNSGTFNPPWVFPILSFIAILPEHIGGVILFWMCLGTWIIVTRKIVGRGMWPVIAVITSPMVINGLLARNIDFMVMWGLFLPPELAVFFYAIKPQVGGAVIIFLGIRAFWEGGWKKIISLYAAPSVITLLSFLFYGIWPLRAMGALRLSWNASPWVILGWPSLIIGGLIFYFAIRRKERQSGERIAMASSPFFSPFVGSQSWVAILPAIMKSKLLYIIWIVLWVWIISLVIR
jgi:hypothetical protein